MVGSPTQNSCINTERLKVKMQYKCAIKEAKARSISENADKINSSLADKNASTFWKCWNSNYSNHKTSSHSPVIDNFSNHCEIAESFRNYFNNIYVKSSDDTSATNEYTQLASNLLQSKDQFCQVSPFEVKDIEEAVNHLALNKTSDPDELVSEHLLHCHPSVIIHLKFLFTFIQNHAYVPESFTSGVIIPIPKDKRGDLTSSSNYRPITVSSVISKVYEYVILNKFSHFLSSDILQFGYKKATGCSNAIFLLRRVIQHFNDKSSNVYIASLDASKAFDRVNHYKLFSKLIKQGFPKQFISIIVNWYSRLNIRVKWVNSLSTTLHVLSGVRQGGVLSGLLFNLYVNDILTTLREKDLGCHLGNMFVGAIMYADDLILLSASVVDLQAMLNNCDKVGNELGLTFNPSKSKCMSVGPHLNVQPSDLLIGHFQLPWVKELPYLGITLIKAKSFLIDLSCIRRKFFVSVNSILSKCSSTSDIVKLKLLESHCLPILLYASESLNLPKFQITELNSWWNSIYRKIFNYNKWESVRSLIFMLGRLDLFHIINLRSLSFINRMFECENNCNNNAFKYYISNVYAVSNECTTLFGKYNCRSSWSISKIKFMISDDFRLSCDTNV